MMHFYKENWAKFLIWICICAFFKILIPAFKFGTLGKNYLNSYKKNVKEILRYPKLTKIIKNEINEGNYSSDKGKKILEVLFTTSDFESKIKFF